MGRTTTTTTSTTTAMENKTSILPLFSLLSSHDTPTRLDATLSLLTTLPVASSSSSSSISSSKKTPAQLDDEDVNTEYTIKRLVTGLGSTNDASRQGFAVALTELFSHLSPTKARAMLPLVLSQSTPTSGADSREERGLLFSRLMGLHAIARSGILFHGEDENSSSSLGAGAGGESFKEVILALHALAGKKTWMREPAYWVLIETIRSLFGNPAHNLTSLPWYPEIGPWLVQRLLLDSREKARGWSPEKVALVLVLQSYDLQVDWEASLSPSFGAGSPLARSSLVALAGALKGTVSDLEMVEQDNNKAPQIGSNAVKTVKRATPNAPGGAPHFVWGIILDLYFPPAEVKEKSPSTPIEKAKWQDFWRIVVDQSLFAQPSLSLKATGFNLLLVAIRRVPPTEVPGLFGAGVVRTLANHLRNTTGSEKTLSRIAQKVAASLPIFLKSNPTESLPVLRALVAPPHGLQTFDPKTVDKLVAMLDPKGVRGWARYLKQYVLGSDSTGILDEEDERTVNTRRLWAFDQLLHIARFGAVEKDEETLTDLLEYFAVLGWFQIKVAGKGARSYIANPPLTPATQVAARSRFFSVLTALPHAPNASGMTWLSRALGLLDNLSNDEKHFAAVAETDVAIMESRETIRKLHRQLNSDNSLEKAGLSLIEGVLLLSYDEGEESAEALEQTKDCIPVLFPTLQASSEGDDAEVDSSDEEGEAPEPSTVLLDVLLELVHRPSAFVKTFAQSVLSGFSDKLGEQAMELLLEQIRPVVMAGEEDNDEIVEKGDSDEDMDSDEEGSGDSASEVSEDEDVDVDEAFRNELLAALQANGVADEFDAAAAQKDEDGTSEEELLDDDQMMVLDDKLAEIFKLQGGGKKERNIDRIDDVHYRLRVLDLLEVLTKHRTPHPLIPLALVPLFAIVCGTSPAENELRLKAGKMLRHVVARKEIPNLPSPNGALDALEELNTKATSVDASELAGLCSQTGVYLAKSALASGSSKSKTVQRIVKVHQESFSAYLNKKNSKTRLQPSFTSDFCSRLPSCAWPLLPTLLTLASEESPVNAYRRVQAFEVAHLLLTSFAAQKTEESNAAVLDAIPAYRTAIYKVISTAITDPSSSFDANRLKELIKLCLAAVRITANLTSPLQLSVIWKGGEFAKLITKMTESSQYKAAISVQRMLRQLVSVVSYSASTQSGAKRPPTDATKTSKLKKVKKTEPINEVEVEIEIQEDADDAMELAASPEKLAKASLRKEKKREKKREKSLAQRHRY